MTSTTTTTTTLLHQELVQPKASPSRTTRGSALPVLLRKSTTAAAATALVNAHNELNVAKSRPQSATPPTFDTPPHQQHLERPPQPPAIGGANQVLSKFPPRSLITHSYLRFLIADCPSDSTLHYYIQEFQRQNVQNVVRVCQPTYNESRLVQEGIQVHVLSYCK